MNTQEGLGGGRVGVFATLWSVPAGMCTVAAW